MAWTIILETEDREVVSSLNVEFEIPKEINLKSFRLLKYLDPYGDTVFNHLQMDDLIIDFNHLMDLVTDPLIAEIISLSKKCKIETHVYLAFYGD